MTGQFDKQEMCWTVFIWGGMVIGGVVGMCASGRATLMSIVWGAVGSLVGVGIGYQISKWMTKRENL